MNRLPLTVWLHVLLGAFVFGIAAALAGIGSSLAWVTMAGGIAGGTAGLIATILGRNSGHGGSDIIIGTATGAAIAALAFSARPFLLRDQPSSPEVLNAAIWLSLMGAVTMPLVRFIAWHVLLLPKEVRWRKMGLVLYNTFLGLILGGFFSTVLTIIASCTCLGGIVAWRVLAWGDGFDQEFLQELKRLMDLYERGILYAAITGAWISAIAGMIIGFFQVLCADGSLPGSESGRIGVLGGGWTKFIKTFPGGGLLGAIAITILGNPIYMIWAITLPVLIYGGLAGFILSKYLAWKPPEAPRPN